MKKFLLTTVAAFFGFSALANPFAQLKSRSDVVCYGREYSQKHLDKHPRQNVEKFRIKLERPESSDPKAGAMRLEVSLKGKAHYYKNYRAWFYCPSTNDSSDEVVCSIECDGGSVRLSLKNKGDVLVVKNNGFVLNGGCGDAESDLHFLENLQGGDDILLAYKLRPEFCQK